MRRTKRIICILLSVLLLVGSISVMATAANETVGIKPHETIAHKQAGIESSHEAIAHEPVRIEPHDALVNETVRIETHDIMEEDWTPRRPAGRHDSLYASSWVLPCTGPLPGPTSLNYLLDTSVVGGWPSYTTWSGIIPVRNLYPSITINLTSDINLASTRLEIPSGRHVTIRSCPVASVANGGPFTITRAFAINFLAGQHFRVDNNATLVLENIILDAWDFSLAEIGLGQHGGVYVQSGATIGSSTPGHLFLGDGAIIRNARGHNGGGVHLGAGGGVSGLLNIPGGMLTMLPGGEIRDSGANRGGGGVYGGYRSLIRMEGTIHNNETRHPLDFIDLFQVFTATGNGGGILLEGGTLNMRGGVISDNTADSFGGGIFANNSSIIAGLFATQSTVNIYGGRIVNNTATPFNRFLPTFTQPQTGFGGGVGVRNSIMNMHGGIIDQNTAVFGAGVYTRGRWGVLAEQAWLPVSTFNMYGGYIENNQAVRHVTPVPIMAGFGGGVRVCNSSLFNMHGGEIRNNEARGGGGVSVGYNSILFGFGDFSIPGEMRMFGGRIHNNNAALDGGAVRISSGRGWLFAAWGEWGVMRMFSGEVEDNNAGRNGGGIWVQNNCRLIVGVNVHGTAEPIGGYENTHIRGNTAAHNGGGIWSDINTCLWIDQVSITGNSAGRDGGGMRLSRYEYRPMLSNNAYRLGRASTISFRDNVHFYENTAGNGAWYPPINATTFGGGRISGAASISPATSHPLNNYDINFHGTARLGTPWTPPELDPCPEHDCDGYLCPDCGECLECGDCQCWEQGLCEECDVCPDCDECLICGNCTCCPYCDGIRCPGCNKCNKCEECICCSNCNQYPCVCPPAAAVIRFHLDGSGRDRGYYIAVPVMLCEIDENLMRIVENSDEWLKVLAIGNIYGCHQGSGRPNEMRGFHCPVPELEIGWEGGLNYAGAFWGWFETECLDPRLNGRANPASAFRILLDGDGEPMRWRPAIGTQEHRVHIGNATSGPIYAYGEANGFDLATLLNGFPEEYFAEGPIDYFGIWIRWGDINDDGITFNSDAALFNTYINTLALVLWGIPMDLPPIHHGAGNITLRGYTFNDGAARLNNFVNDLALILWGIPLENPTRLGTARPLGESCSVCDNCIVCDGCTC